MAKLVTYPSLAAIYWLWSCQVCVRANVCSWPTLNRQLPVLDSWLTSCQLLAWGSLALYPSDMNPKFVQSWPKDQWNGSISPLTTFHLAAYRHQLHSIWQQFAISFISSGSISPLAMLSKSTSTIFHLTSLSSAWSWVHPILTIDQLVKWQHIAINYISYGIRSPSVSSLCNVMLGNTSPSISHLN